jgi:hypothetical protein
MPVFAELVAIELVVTVSAGVVLAFVSGLLSRPKRNALRHEAQACHNCGSVGKVAPGQPLPARGHRP